MDENCESSHLEFAANLWRGGTIIGHGPRACAEAFPVLARLLALALLVVALLGPAHVVGAAEPFAPIAASAMHAPDAQIIVGWLPGEDPADSYRVYGLAPDGAATLIADQITGLSVTVPEGFAGYAVTALRLGMESQQVKALETECRIVISYNPPGAGYWCPETRKAGLVPDVRSPTWL